MNIGIDKVYKLENCVASRDSGKSYKNVWLFPSLGHITTPVALATNGRMLCIVPMMVVEGSLSDKRPVNPEVFERARRNPTSGLMCVGWSGDNACVQDSRLTSSISEPIEWGDDEKDDLPKDVHRLLEPHANNNDVVSICLNAQYLAKLADAMACEDGQVELRIKLTGDSDPGECLATLKPIHVIPYSRHNEARGVLMPLNGTGRNDWETDDGEGY